MRKILVPVFITAAMMLAGNAYSAIVQVFPGGNGVYYLKGAEFVNIGGVEIEIQYDTATLANPRITAGTSLASTMFFPNPRFSASTVKIVAATLSPISSGDLATITFDVKGGNPPVPSIIRSKLATVTAAAVKPDTPTGSEGSGGNSGGGYAGGGSIGGSNQGSSSTTASISSGSGSSLSGNTSAGTPSVGTITLPQDMAGSTPSADKKPDSQPLVTDLRKDMTLPLGDSAGQQAAAADQKAEAVKVPEKKSVAYASTLQLFKKFSGDKTPKNLISLFAEVPIPGFTQEPPIVFSDGITPVKITLVIRQTESESPRFMLNGAKTLNLSSEGEGSVTWTIEALPKKGAYEAQLTVIDGKAVMEFPITVAPPVNPLVLKGKVLSEADFIAYLSGPARIDMNGDGKFDAVDDYIYTANYIAGMKIKPVKAVPQDGKPAVKGKEESGKSLDKKPVKP